MIIFQLIIRNKALARSCENKNSWGSDIRTDMIFSGNNIDIND